MRTGKHGVLDAFRQLRGKVYLEHLSQAGRTSSCGHVRSMIPSQLLAYGARLGRMVIHDQYDPSGGIAIKDNSRT